MRKLVNLQLSLLIIVAILLAACDQNNSTPEIPTLIPDTLPEDPTPTAENMEATVPPEPTERPNRPTLPPTWTPTAIPETPTPVPTETQAAVEQGPDTAPRTECANFGPDMSVSEENFALGRMPTVGWTSVPNAELYWLVLTDINGTEVHEAFIAETTYTFPADIFLGPVRYGWEVRPLDAAGIQMCVGRGATLLPQET